MPRPACGALPVGGWLRLKRVWYLRRLASMQPMELAYRFRQRLRIRAEERAHAARQPRSAGPRADWLQRYRSGESPFFFSPEGGEALALSVRRAFPEGVRCALEEAERVCRHEIRLFGSCFACGHPHIAWHRDPRTGFAWPQTFWASIETRAPATGVGPLWVWRLGQHHHVTILAKAFLLSRQERFAEEAIAQITDWIAANPPGTGVHWASPLAMAIRLINWCWTLAFLRSSLALTPEAFGQILDSIHFQADHIAHHLSFHSSANNHLVGEAAGLAFVSLCFPWLEGAAGWKSTGLRMLAQEVGKQIHPDGGSAEQANHYLLEVMEYNLLVWRLAEIAGERVPQVWLERLSASADFLAAMTDGNGRILPLGDGDDGWAVQLDAQPQVSRPRSLLASAAVVLGRADLKGSAVGWDETSYWLLGETGRATFDDWPDGKPSEQSVIFRDSGYDVGAGGTGTLVMDFGPLGYLSTAAHGHADALSLMILVGGIPALVDPGTYAYHEGGDWRRFFRSTLAHNTIAIDGLDQSEMWGTFLWGRKARARLLVWHSDAEHDYVRARHDGYAPRGVIHVRSVLFHKPAWIVVRDELRGRGVHQVEQTWHFAPGGKVREEPEGVGQCVDYATHAISIFPSKAPGIAPIWVEGVEDPPQGWVSTAYGIRQPAPVLSLRGTCPLPLRLTTVFRIHGVASADQDLREEAVLMLETLEAKLRA